VVVGLLGQLRGELDGEALRAALDALSIAMQVAVIGLVHGAAPALHRRQVHQLARSWVANLSAFGMRAAAHIESMKSGPHSLITRVELNAARPGVTVELGGQACVRGV
jgi:hypothetical protein